MFIYCDNGGKKIKEGCTSYLYVKSGIFIKSYFGNESFKFYMKASFWPNVFLTDKKVYHLER